MQLYLYSSLKSKYFTKNIKMTSKQSFHWRTYILSKDERLLARIQIRSSFNHIFESSDVSNTQLNFICSTSKSCNRELLLFSFCRKIFDTFLLSSLVGIDSQLTRLKH